MCHSLCQTIVYRWHRTVHTTEYTTSLPTLLSPFGPFQFFSRQNTAMTQNQEYYCGIQLTIGGSNHSFVANKWSYTLQYRFRVQLFNRGRDMPIFVTPL